ncbi:GntR family transcriptional regulator [Paraburkholderia ginsengiterrae]|uniref:GntR family transcriptional regulator n=1 Tax=Paraburkholderia ginsengiterrae TaxID=1462993 RepID=A0A1A9N3G7_9BURK|nr:GntR family transcriptional regulator [Paraburkholderia ginsengiterrae]OAJ56001.1 GntR family transcriptional regulator [Paraburkholderia ginsengiterrae]OAJ58612.1 GntR family transcriptional regulator [Paraburkholderia ginsengiterrae]
MKNTTTIDKRSLDRQAADWIRGAIVAGDLSPGARLTEIALAEQIGLSRSTVRSAMQRLAGEGLLVQHAYTGWEVVTLTPEDAWELYTLRCSLEGLAARLAAERIDDAGRAVLTAALNELKDSIAVMDRRRVALADLTVHRTIVTLAKHRRLSMQYGLVIEPVHLYILSTNSMTEPLEAIVPEHEELVDSILRGDVQTAERLASEHVSKHGLRLVELLRAQEANG